MHILNRLLVVTALLLCVSSLGPMTAAVTALTREEAAGRMESVLEDAKDGYRESAAISQSQRVQERVLEASAVRLRELTYQKQRLRREVALTLESIRSIGNRADELALSEQRTRETEGRERERLITFVREAYARGVTAQTGPRVGGTLARRLLGAPLGESVAADLRSAAIVSAQQQLTVALVQSRETSQLAQEKLRTAAGMLTDRLVALQAEREKVLKEYLQTEKRREQAERSLTVSTAQLAEIRAETAAVQVEVLRMQGELAQIDARIRAKAERELIQKGLRESKPGRYDQQSQGAASFGWPVIGASSAAYHDASYQRYFGVPHQGQDIAVPQSTSVAAAADGVVFLARDGGTHGYSYMLIGHRDGYATLYGHLSSFAVQTGDDVRRGEVIGSSGGQPGSHGAGPMTTGPHLHFEVMKNGVHIDPLSVLPN